MEIARGSMVDQTYLENKRRYIRYEMNARGEVTFEDGSTTGGFIRDISIGGAFMELEHIDKSLVNHVVFVKIFASTHQAPVLLESECKIAHVANDGIGLFFHKMDESGKRIFVEIIRDIKTGLGT